VNTDLIPKLGELLDSEQSRDAIHIAIMSMVATVRLFPGQHLEHGIVDPFLIEPVEKGRRCWLLLYPGTITSLRHEWTHPAIDRIGGKSRSEQWMRAWAVEHVSYDCYGEGNKSEDAAYAFALDVGRTHSLGPYEPARDAIDGEWWAHWEAITGQRGDRNAYFSCAC
jgi:hypothetical protein